MSKLTTAELKARKKIYQQRYLEKKRLREAEALQPSVDYKEMYENAMKENTVLQNKNIELEKLCKAYTEREQAALKALHNATLEYNARNKHMLDCVKHAYVSMQFAVNAVTKED